MTIISALTGTHHQFGTPPNPTKFHYFTLYTEFFRPHLCLLELNEQKQCAVLEILELDFVPYTSLASPNVAQPSFEYGELSRRTDSGESISLHTASEIGNLAIMQLLLDTGAELNKRKASHRTPLDGVSKQGKIEAARLLIRHGADVNLRDKIGRTALHKASRFGHLDIDRLLLGNGADVNVTEVDNWTPLRLASHDRHADVVRLLLERG